MKPMTTGKRIRFIRETLGLSQKEFAAKLKVKISSISELENDRSKPGFDFITALFTECKINLYYALFGKGSMFFDDAQAIFLEESDFAVKPEIARNFLHDFRQSHILQFYVLSEYLTRMETHRTAIEKEIKRTK